MANAEGAKPGSRKKLVIAIDGPAGSGKSTLAALLARRYNYTNIETGAMYRALALKAIESSVPLDEGKRLAALAQQSKIELVPNPEGNRVLLDGVDVSERLRSPEVTESASRVSVHPEVREWMVASQRRMGADGGIGMKGRVQPKKEWAVREERRARNQADRTRATSPLIPAPDAVQIDSTYMTLDQV